MVEAEWERALNACHAPGQDSQPAASRCRAQLRHAEWQRSMRSFLSWLRERRGWCSELEWLLVFETRKIHVLGKAKSFFPVPHDSFCENA
mmetsp:Transcript_98016/g.277542  ORF Transcript_98016/g.277542 Transcript_98016/m.277542 type:complete len:90 (+) Transcript_98016:64-333(+)